MSKLPSHWEADIRQQVEAHVFDYDPQAWAAMEELLGEAGAATGSASEAGTPAPSTNSTSAAGKLWLGVLIILSAGLLAWVITDKNAPVPATWSSWPIGVEEGLEEPLSTSEADTEAPLKMLEERLFLKTAPVGNQEVERIVVAPTKEQKVIAPTGQRGMQLIRDFKLATRLPTLKFPDSLSSQQVIVDTLPIQPQLPLELDVKRRRRDRNSLFPDVIDQY